MARVGVFFVFFTKNPNLKRNKKKKKKKINFFFGGAKVSDFFLLKTQIYNKKKKGILIVFSLGLCWGAKFILYVCT